MCIYLKRDLETNEKYNYLNGENSRLESLKQNLLMPFQHIDYLNDVLSSLKKNMDVSTILVYLNSLF